MLCTVFCVDCFFFQAEDGIRDLVRSRGLGDVYKRQRLVRRSPWSEQSPVTSRRGRTRSGWTSKTGQSCRCLLYTSDAADERSSVDLGGRRIIKKKKRAKNSGSRQQKSNNDKNVYESTKQEEQRTKKSRQQ